MRKDRLLAFSDGMFAIIITIMVLELKAPHEPSWEALGRNAPVFVSYVLSFIYVGLYWNNHHHMLESVQRINGATLWANLHLLFWLSLVPYATAWLGETHFAAIPAAIYGGVLLLAALAWLILQRVLIGAHPDNQLLARAVGRDTKGKISIALYILGIAVSLLKSWLAVLIYATVAIIWLIPDRRLEKAVTEAEKA